MPTGAAATPATIVPVPTLVGAAAATPESVSSSGLGAWNPAIGADRSTCAKTSGKGCAVGSAEARAPSRADKPAASRRALTSGAAARASTSSSGPKRGSCGNVCPMRAASVPIVVSVTKGTVPVTAS